MSCRCIEFQLQVHSGNIVYERNVYFMKVIYSTFCDTRTSMMIPLVYCPFCRKILEYVDFVDPHKKKMKLKPFTLFYVLPMFEPLLLKDEEKDKMGNPDEFFQMDKTMNFPCPGCLSGKKFH